MNRHGACAALLLAAVLAACAAPRPVVYQGEHPDAIDGARVDRDIEECLAAGKNYHSPSQGIAGSDVGRATAVGGAVGGAAGAAGGAIYGNAGRGAAVGAAGGAAGALLGSLFRRSGPDPVYQAAVNRCLQDRKRQVLAWE
jgi:hypothetical protein